MIRAAINRIPGSARLLVALGAAAIAALIVAAPAQAQVANPGPIELTVEGGVIATNDGPPDGAEFPLGEGEEQITLSGEIAADGTLTVPAEDVVFPPVQINDPVPTDISITATDDVTGSIDPVSGAADADLSLEVLIEPATLAECVMSVDVSLSTAGPEGAPYDTGDGTFTVSEDTFAVPATTPVSDPLSLCPQVDEALGLPAPGGTNLARFEISSDPILEPEGGEPGAFHVEFNHGILNLGVNDPLVFLADDERVTFDGEIDPDTGEISVAAEDVVLPPIMVTQPLEATITTIPEEDVTGTFDAETGALDLEMVVTSTTATLGTECTFEGFEWSLSTANTTPYEGIPFSDGLDGPGAIVANWEDIPPVTPDSPVCNTVRGLGAGPGGLLYEHRFGPPPEADLAISVRPKKRTVRQGRKTTFRATVTNTGDADATGVRVCVQAPSKPLRVGGGKCREVGELAAGAEVERRVKIKAKGNARPKAYRLRFKANSPDTDPVTAQARVRVKRR